MTLTIRAFEKARRIEGYRTPITDIGINRYGILTPEHPPEEILSTRYANVCSGWALLSEETDRVAGIMHIYSDCSFFVHGETAVRRHTAKAWEIFADALNKKTSAMFSAVAFGGHKFPVKKTPRISKDSMNRYFDTQKELGQIMQEDRYKAIGQQIDDELKLPRPNIKNCMQLLKDRESITKKQMDYFRSPETRTLSRNMSHLVSFWINDEAHRRAITCKAVNVKADFRYQSAPHDAFIDRKNGEISVASSDDNILGNLPYPEKSQGIRMFKGWDIELQPVSPVKYTCKRAPNTQQQEVRYA